jgi:hypothetical protein
MSSSSSLTQNQNESTITCDNKKLRKVLCDVLNSYESLYQVSTKELRTKCEKKLNIPIGALKAPQNKELFDRIIIEYSTHYNNNGGKVDQSIIMNSSSSSSSSSASHTANSASAGTSSNGSKGSNNITSGSSSDSHRASAGTSSSSSKDSSNITSGSDNDIGIINTKSKKNQDEEADYKGKKYSDAESMLILKVCKEYVST